MTEYPEQPAPLALAHTNPLAQALGPQQACSAGSQEWASRLDLEAGLASPSTRQQVCGCLCLPQSDRAQPLLSEPQGPCKWERGRCPETQG